MSGTYENKKDINMITVIPSPRSVVPTMNAILRRGDSVICGNSPPHLLNQLHIY